MITKKRWIFVFCLLGVLFLGWLYSKSYKVCDVQMFDQSELTSQMASLIESDKKENTYIHKLGQRKILVYDNRDPQNGYVTARVTANVHEGELNIKITKDCAANDMYMTGSVVSAVITLPEDVTINYIHLDVGFLYPRYW